MAHEQEERLEFFRAFIKAAEGGAAIPPVTEDDLRLLHGFPQTWRSGVSAKTEWSVSILMARVCSLGVNLPAVWLRYTQLRLLIMQGAVTEWQHREGWDDAVYRVAATIPMNGLQLDRAAFLQRLHYKTAA